MVVRAAVEARVVPVRVVRAEPGGPAGPAAMALRVWVRWGRRALSVVLVVRVVRVVPPARVVFGVMVAWAVPVVLVAGVVMGR